MGFRETYGKMVEDALNSAVDKYLDAEGIKVQLHAEIDKLIDGQLADIKEKLKANVIDQIDGIDQVPNV
jgi:hypothetical protein